MKSVRIFPTKEFVKKDQLTDFQAQLEAGKAFTALALLHKKARSEEAPWPNRNDLQKHLKGKFALHSQSLQMISHTFLCQYRCHHQSATGKQKDSLSL